MSDGPDLGGILVVDKPAGMTSHDLVARVRRLAGTRRVGHAGTLDPAATGVLVLGIEWSTRLLTWLAGHDKEYTATIRFGRSTMTDDAEGETVGVVDPTGLTDEAVAAAAAGLTGDVEQVPSAVSAVKVAGVRSYARVRSGESVELEPRRIHVARFDVAPLRWSMDGLLPGELPWCEADVEVEVSSGTYVRALARDLGRQLGTGAHLTALRRTRSGPFGIGEAVALTDLHDPAGVAAHLQPAGEAVTRFLPVLTVADQVGRALRYGRRPAAQGTGQPTLAILDWRGGLVAVADDSGSELRPLVVVPAES